MGHGFKIKQGDMLPVIAGVCLNADGNGKALTAAASAPVVAQSIEFHMRASGAASAFIVAQATSREAASGAGAVEYVWSGVQTATVGYYEGEFKVTFAGSAPLTFPNSRNIPIRVYPRVS